VSSRMKSNSSDIAVTLDRGPTCGEVRPPDGV
jgi:hypothetical protein